MLTARQGQALPRLAVLYRHVAGQVAESSRQAQVRSLTFGSRDYGSSAALARPNDDFDDTQEPIRPPEPAPMSSSVTDVDAVPPRGRGRNLPRDGPAPTSRRRPRSPRAVKPFSKGDFLRTDERFRRMVKEAPIGAFLALRSVPRHRLTEIDPKDVKAMLWQLTRVPRESVTQASGQEITECFEILRSILQAQPTSATQPYDGDLGVNLRGKLLRSLIRAAANMGADRFAVDLFFERVDMQLRRPNQRIISLKQIATDITHNRWWLLGARLLDPERIPKELLSPEVITVAMNCALIARRPWDAKKLFAMMHPDEAGPDAICYHLQALLQLGDKDGAHRVMQDATERGVDPEKIQVAMMKGGGRGEDMEDTVRDFMVQMHQRPTTTVLNAMLGQRLAMSDIAGAQRIVSEFEGVGAGEVAPNAETVTHLINLASRMKNRQYLEWCWAKLSEHPKLVNQKSVALLLRALTNLGAIDEAIAVFQALVRSERVSEPWTIPDDFRPGVWVANAAMQAAISEHGYQGFTRIAELMREGMIEPDERTVQITLRYARANLISSPIQMATLFEELLSRTSAPPTAEQLNELLHNVVRVAFRDPLQAKKYLGVEDKGGEIVPLTGKLKSLLAERVREVAESGQIRSPRSLSNRLLYDALALDGAWPADAVRQTWQLYVLDGWRPAESNYVSLITAYSRTGNMQAAEEVLQYASEVGQQPTRAMLTELIRGFGRNGVPQAAREYYHKINQPDSLAFTETIKAYLLSNEAKQAVGFIRRELHRITELDERGVKMAAIALANAYDAPGAIFWIAHHVITARGGDSADMSPTREKFPLTNSLRPVVQDCVKRISKMGAQMDLGSGEAAHAIATEMAAERASGLSSYSDPDSDLPSRQDEAWDAAAYNADADLYNSDGFDPVKQADPTATPTYLSTQHSTDPDIDVPDERLAERRAIWTVRILQSMRLAVRMLQDDDAVRPRGSRRRPVLNKRAIGSLVDNLDVEAEFEHWKAQWRRDAENARKTARDRSEVRRLKAERDAAWAQRAERSEAGVSGAGPVDPTEMSTPPAETETRTTEATTETTTETKTADAEAEPTEAELEAEIEAEIAAAKAEAEAEREQPREQPQRREKKKEKTK